MSLIFLTLVFSICAVQAQDSISISADVASINVDLSDLTTPDADNPYVTVEVPVTIDGFLSDPSTTLTVTVTPGNGLYLHSYQVEPFQGDLPASTTISLMVFRNSDLGARNAIIEIRYSGLTDQASVSLVLARERIEVTISEPVEGETSKPGEYSILGWIEPAIEGVIVNVDLYHKYPQLKTEEQIQGMESGIRYRGIAVTRGDGTFAIEPETVAFERGRPVRADEIEGGLWYVHFFSNGAKLFGDDLDRVDHDDPHGSVHGGVKTFETDYAGIPEVTGGDVPEDHVRKFVLNAFPQWYEDLPILPGLTRPFLGILPSEALPYAPYIVLLAILLLAYLVMRTIMKMSAKRSDNS
ncbi:MAG: hypothetical protein HXS50_05790 [Theionarchaea archaeon]|nr:hypothetical protein [Theionarchaea archaeon]